MDDRKAYIDERIHSHMPLYIICEQKSEEVMGIDKEMAEVTWTERTNHVGLIIEYFERESGKMAWMNWIWVIFKFEWI